MRAMSIALSLIFAALLPTFGHALETISNPPSNNLEIAATTKEELLLFWEEKDLYVQSPTRNMKPISQVAENITVVTAKEIEDMNAHTVSEVLNRVSGVFVDFQGQDFGSTVLLHIQGSETRHVLVLLDGVPLNYLSGGNADTSTIPVKIIERIEVIKGPASSAWGSSLGGVINVITKSAGNNTTPAGSVSASYGESSSQDDNGEVLGKAGPVGYYLFAGHQHSNGLRPSRAFDDNSVYAKITVPASKDVNINFTTGYSEPHIIPGDFLISDFTERITERAFFATASIDAAMSRELSFQATLYTFSRRLTLLDTVLGVTGAYAPISVAGDLFDNPTFNDEITGGSAKLVWTHGMHTAVFGTDIDHGSLDTTLINGPFIQSLGAPATITGHSDIDKWALFMNDTMTTGKFSLTPGIRYDHNSITGSFTSPSIETTYKIAERTIIRASAARGFTMPPLAFTSTGGLFFDPNPSLKPEKVWSYQAGVESNLTDLVWARLTLFQHDMKDGIVKELYAAGPPSFNDLFINKDSIRRRGYELELETAPISNVSLKTGFAYVRIEPSGADAVTQYMNNTGLKYDDKKSFMAELFGHYIWWGGHDNAAYATGKYNTYLWDLNLRKTVFSTRETNTDVFFTAHNIFNADQYTLDETKNPRRWVEAGVRLKF